MSRARSIFGADNTPWFVRNKQSLPLHSGWQKDLISCPEERAGTAWLAGTTQQIQNLSFAARTKLPHDPVGRLGAANDIAARCNNSHFANFVRNLSTDS
jgi:hypothetical protein